MQVLYDAINDVVAMRFKDRNLVEVSIKEIFDAWFEEAASLRATLVNCGLTKTVEHLDKIIENQSKFAPKE